MENINKAYSLRKHQNLLKPNTSIAATLKKSKAFDANKHKAKFSTEQVDGIQPKSLCISPRSELRPVFLSILVESEDRLDRSTELGNCIGDSILKTETLI